MWVFSVLVELWSGSFLRFPNIPLPLRVMHGHASVFLWTCLSPPPPQFLCLNLLVYSLTKLTGRSTWFVNWLRSMSLQFVPFLLCCFLFLFDTRITFIPCEICFWPLAVDLLLIGIKVYFFYILLLLKITQRWPFLLFSLTNSHSLLHLYFFKSILWQAVQKAVNVRFVWWRCDV